MWSGHSCPPLLIRRVKIRSVIAFAGRAHRLLNITKNLVGAAEVPLLAQNAGNEAPAIVARDPLCKRSSLQEIYDAGLKLSVSRVWVDAARPFIR